MRNRFFLVVCLIVAAAVVVLWWPRSDVSPTGGEPVVSEQKSPATAPTESPPSAPSPTDMVAAELVTTPAEPAAPAGRTDPNNPFRVDAAGKLVLDEQTRLNMEALFAQTDRAALPEAQQNITSKLPPSAAAAAADLLERYDNYSKAQRQAYPPGVAPATEEAALAELEGLHALRVAHFGPETAKALYGNEESVTRSLIDLMRVEKDQGLTMEQKAERAQRLHDEIAARQPDRG